MAKQKRISVSFSKEYAEEYKFITGINNASDFICKAIREKIKNNLKEPFDLEDKIRNIVIKVVHDELDSLQKSNKQDISRKQDASGVNTNSPIGNELIEAVDYFEL